MIKDILFPLQNYFILAINSAAKERFHFIKTKSNITTWIVTHFFCKVGTKF